MTAPSLLAPADPACCDGEEWKPVPGWPHEASTCGRVRAVDRVDGNGVWRLGGLLPQHPDQRRGKGYLYGTLRDGARRRKAPVAVLVLEAHRGLRPLPGWQACHGPGGRTDNHLANLRWDSREANLAEMWEGRRAVTAPPGDVTDPAFPQDSAVRAASRHGVTGDGLHGTGSFCLPPNFPFHSLSVKRALRALTRSLRSLRRSR